MPNLIPNVTEIFYSSNGTLLEIRGNALYHAQSNYANLLLVYIEDGNGADTTTLVNFSPLKFQSTTKPVFTSHWFFMNYLGETQDTIDGETANRSFSKFSINVPNSVLRYNNFSMNKDTVTVIQRYGSNYLGTFKTLSDLRLAYPDNTNYSNTGTVADLDALLALTSVSTNAIYQVTDDSFDDVTSFNSISAMLASTGKTTGDKILIAPLQQYYEYLGGTESLIASYRTIPRPTEFTTTAYKYLGGGISNFNNWQNVLTPSNLSDGLYTAYVISASGFHQVISLSWTETESINSVLQTKQYNTFEISVNAGLSNIDDLTPIETTATQMIMQSVANIEQQYFTTNSLLSSHIDDTDNPHRTSIYNLIDTDVPETPTTNGIILRYNSTSQKYEDSTSLTTAESNIGALQTRMGLAENNIGGLQSIQENIINGLQDITYDNEISELTATTIKGAIDENNALIDSAQDDVDTHVARTDNPHQVTKTQLGLSDVDNTSDLDKPISTATQNALDNKVDLNPTVVSSLSSTDFIYGQQGGAEKRITVTDLKTSIIENLVAFGYVKFTEKDENGQPDITNPQTNKIYLFNPTDSDLPNDQFEEWIYIDADDIFEKIGTTAIALEDYYDIDEVDGLLSDYDLTTVVDEKIQDAKTIHYYPNTKNTSGSLIPKGSNVKFVSATGDVVNIAQATGTDVANNPEIFMGVAEDNISSNAFGNVVWFGEITDVDLTGFSTSSLLYFDTSNGGFTTSIPTTNKIIVAAVVKGGSDGVLLVRPKFVSRDIDEIDGLTDALAGKSAVGHTHTKSEITDFAHTHLKADITDFAHTHAIADVTNLQTALDTVGQVAGQTTKLGFEALNSVTAGDRFSTAVGHQALRLNTTGSFNTAVGRRTLEVNTTGEQNTAQGANALISNTTGNNNTAQGLGSLFSNTTGNNNTAQGHVSLFGNTTGSSNSSLGAGAGRYIANGSTANTTGSSSVFIGSDTKALADNQTNQIVIGHNATGKGSNTATIGNDSITATYLKGAVSATTSVTTPSVVATSTVKIGAWTLSQNGTSGSLDFVVV
jgi:hypothetical protein